ncbi:hypothetical protein [Streptomyces sp. NPDC090083]|uniref:hypothetical protein n=1 Tax=Streptomyces sp. NPDC090083 TaxID=3365941 RepID=UPI0037FBCCF6
MADRFGSVLSRPTVTSYFNVQVGRDLTIGELFQHHHAVLRAGGAPDDRKLGVDGEHLDGVHAAWSFHHVPSINRPRARRL